MTSVVPQNQNRCVFVGNIPYDATEEQLIQICEEVGPVVSFRLVLDKETGKPKGYGFCEYKDEETALSARRNLQGYEINGRQLRVDFAENGKNADRNRDQGRGGPGVAPNTDGQKQLGGPSASNDPTGHQPLGIPSALSAMSAMAGVLNGSQSGLANQPGPDPLTNFLARMTRHQLLEVISEIKLLATQNAPVARQLLQGSPQLLKALFQAEIMLGLEKPQAMQQMASSLRPASSHLGQSQLPPKPVLPVPTAPSIRPLAPQNPNLAVPQQNPNLQNPNLVAPPKNPNVQIQPPPIMQQQNPRPQFGVGVAPPNQRPPPVPVPSSSMQQSFYPRPPAQAVPNEVRPWSELTHPSKLRRVEDVTYHPNPMAHNVPPVNLPLAQTAISSVGPASQHTTSSGTPQQPPHKQSPQISPEVVQQVLNLTPEQLSSLPVEQQQQVLQLQKMLSSNR
ncbi:hypothetical protein LUZ60_007759 [Juncus effusus]|nr:hypothetical protein LUZ60_007759 [Juncus effusus]